MEQPRRSEYTAYVDDPTRWAEANHSTIEIDHPSFSNSSGNIPIWQQEKQGGKYCCCCCDYRRAVIVTSILAIISNVFSLLSGEATVVVFFLGTAGSFSGLMGALRFDIRLVALQLIQMLGMYKKKA